MLSIIDLEEPENPLQAYHLANFKVEVVL
jgi:hypothetical protein